jgi:hypothetical protein
MSQILACVWNMIYNPRPQLLAPDQQLGVKRSKMAGALRAIPMLPRLVHHNYPNEEVFGILLKNVETWLGHMLQRF